MSKRARNIVPYSRSYRRPPRWGMGLPPRKPSRWCRLANPAFYLKAVMVLATLALVVVPYGADALNAALGPRGQEGCRVVSVIDGDTVSFWCPGRGLHRARLAGLDAPELFSPQCGAEWVAAQKATWALRRLLWGAQTLTVRDRGTDRYQRRLVDLSADGTSLAPTLIAAGHARPYRGGPRRGWCG